MKDKIISEYFSCLVLLVLRLILPLKVNMFFPPKNQGFFENVCMKSNPGRGVMAKSKLKYQKKWAGTMQPKVFLKKNHLQKWVQNSGP